MTLSYSQVFHKALTAAEIYRRQIALSHYSVTSLAEVESVVNKLVRLGLVRRVRGLIVPSPAGSITVDETDTSRLRSAKLHEANAVAQTLRRLPWIRAVALTGSIAAGSAKPNDDCDFFIITAPHSLWLTRLMVLLYAKFKGKRRSFAKEEPNSWCFNMWLSDNNLMMPTDMRSLYTAYELCQAVWLVNKYQTAERFITTNSWAHRLLPVYYRLAYDRASRVNLNMLPESEMMARASEGVGSLCNWLCFIFQYLYMLPHKTTEWVGYGHAFFHPRPTGRLTMDQLQNRLEYYLYSVTEEEPKKNQKVLVTGVFDLLHAKHRQFLTQAAQLGEIWVGVETDLRVRRLKGWDRPFEPAWLRVMRLNKRPEVAQAFILPDQIQEESIQRQLLSKIRPAVLAVSASTPNLVKKRQMMAEVDGRVEIVLEHDHEISTTLIAQGKSQYK